MLDDFRANPALFLSHYLGSHFVMRIRDTPRLTAPMDFTIEALMATLAGPLDERIKPLLILRPLSDMTPAEALHFINEVMGFRKQINYPVRDYKIDKGFLSFTNPTDTTQPSYLLIKNWSPEGDGEWIFNCSYSMRDVIWLLEHSFDIFGLIPEGLAISINALSPIVLSLKQQADLLSLWHLYGNHGSKATHHNHAFINYLLNEGLDTELFYRQIDPATAKANGFEWSKVALTDECVKEVRAVLNTK